MLQDLLTRYKRQLRAKSYIYLLIGTLEVQKSLGLGNNFKVAQYDTSEAPQFKENKLQALKMTVSGLKHRRIS